MDTNVQCKDLMKLKKEIDKRLTKTDVLSIKKLILYLDGNMIYEGIKHSDTQLIMLQIFLIIWLKEKTKLEMLETESDIFEGVHSLNDLEEKYWIITFVILRFENKVSYYDCMEGIETLIGYKISAVAIDELIYRESEKRSSNIVNIANAFLNVKYKTMSYCLLQLGMQRYPNDEDIMKKLDILDEDYHRRR